jgi:ankyrin repeat protein
MKTIITAIIVTFLAGCSQPTGSRHFGHDLAVEQLSPCAADEPLLPASVNQIIGRIRAKMPEAEVEKVVQAYYPTAKSTSGDWSGQTGYVEFKLTPRYSISIGEYNAPNDFSQRFVHADMLMYVYDGDTKRRINISVYQWENEKKMENRTSEPVKTLEEKLGTSAIPPRKEAISPPLITASPPPPSDKTRLVAASPMPSESLGLYLETESRKGRKNAPYTILCNVRFFNVNNTSIPLWKFPRVTFYAEQGGQFYALRVIEGRGGEISEPYSMSGGSSVTLPRPPRPGRWKIFAVQEHSEVGYQNHLRSVGPGKIPLVYAEDQNDQNDGMWIDPLVSNAITIEFAEIGPSDMNAAEGVIQGLIKADQYKTEFRQPTDNPINKSIASMTSLASAKPKLGPKPMDDFFKSCKSGTSEQVVAAIAAGADVNAKDKDGYTPLMLAGWSNTRPEFIAALLKAGAEVNAKGRNGGGTPLSWAVTFNHNPEIVTTLLKASAAANADHKIDMMPLLMMAAAHNNPEIIELLIKEGAEVNTQNGNGVTPLMEAARYNDNPKVTETLIKAGAKINAKGRNGETSLIAAARDNKNGVKVIAVLIEAGSDINAKDNEGKTPLINAVMFNGNKEIIAALIKAGADVNVKDNEGITPLMVAGFCWGNNSNLDIIAALIKAGANVNAKHKLGMTPLMVAAAYSKPEVIAALLQARAEANAQDNEGTTPLMSAARENGSPAVIATLVKAGAKVNAKNNKGQTPLMMATVKRDRPVEIVVALLKSGADVNAKDNDGKSALDYARMMENQPIIAELIKAGAK